MIIIVSVVKEAEGLRIVDLWLATLEALECQQYFNVLWILKCITFIRGTSFSNPPSKIRK